MSNINIDKSIIKYPLSSSRNIKTRKSEPLFHPRASSVTISKIKKKNILNKDNKEKNFNNQSILDIDMEIFPINKNILNKEKEINSQKKSIKKIDYNNNDNDNDNNVNIKNDLFEKIDIFIEDDLIEEEIIEENNKIKSVLNNLIFWDNEHLTDRKEKNNNSLIAYIQKEKSISYSKNTIEKNFNKTQRRLSVKKGQKLLLDKKPNIYKLKYKILNSDKKDEKEKNNQFDIDGHPKFKDNNLLINLKKERKRLEITQKEELKRIYKGLIINKIKKNKYSEVLNSVYHLLDKARTEFNLSVDILEKRIETTQKFYEAIIKDYEIQHHFFKNNDKKPSKSINTIDILNYTLNTNFKKGKTKINNLEIYEAKIKSYREYLSIVEDINNEIKQYENKFRNIQMELNYLIIQINQKLSELAKENNKLKIIYKELSYKETQYYLSILKTGTDTRADGLSWIIKRLMELNIPINYSIFPKFLDKDEINYLIKLAKLELEKSQIKTIIETLKHQKKKNNVTKTKIINNNTTDRKSLYKKFKFNINMNDDNNNNYFGSKLIDKLIEQYNKHYIMKNKLYNYKKQNSADNLILKNIKDKINIFAHNKDFSIFNKLNNKGILNSNQKEKEQYYSILFLSEREKQLNLYINNLRKKEYIKFKEKFNAIEIKELIYKKYYHQVFNALFGTNTIDILSSKD